MNLKNRYDQHEDEGDDRPDDDFGFQGCRSPGSFEFVFDCCSSLFCGEDAFKRAFESVLLLFLLLLIQQFIELGIEHVASGAFEGFTLAGLATLGAVFHGLC